MAIIHVVLFKFKPETEPSKIQEICNRMVDLRNQCIHPASQKPYITSSTGGRQNSSEAGKADYTHAFVVEFASVEDRDYYTVEDPAHWEFKKAAKEVMEKVGVVDYSPGVY